MICAQMCVSVNVYFCVYLFRFLPLPPSYFKCSFQSVIEFLFLHFVTCFSLPCHPLMIYLKLQLKDTVHKLTGPHLHLKCRALKPQACRYKWKGEGGMWDLDARQNPDSNWSAATSHSAESRHQTIKSGDRNGTSLCDDPP